MTLEDAEEEITVLVAELDAEKQTVFELGEALTHAKATICDLSRDLRGQVAENRRLRGDLKLLADIRFANDVVTGADRLAVFDEIVSDSAGHSLRAAGQ